MEIFNSKGKLLLIKMLCPGSESNSSMLTFDGVDVMGKRLADEVRNAFLMRK